MPLYVQMAVVQMCGQVLTTEPPLVLNIGGGFEGTK